MKKIVFILVALFINSYAFTQNKILIWDSNLKLMSSSESETHDTVMIETHLSDAKFKNGQYIVYVGQSISNADSFVFYYNPILTGDFFFYGKNKTSVDDLINRLSDSNMLIKPIAAVIDSLPDGQWYLLKKENNLVNLICLKSIKNYKLDGKIIQWYKNGRIRAIDIFKDGFAIDSGLWFWSNGQLRSKKYYKSDSGIIKEEIGYDSNGIVNYYYNINIGFTFTFYDNQSIKSMNKVNKYLYDEGLIFRYKRKEDEK